jgi:hypothetical protein
MNLRKERIMGGKYINGLLDAYIDGVLSREELATLSQMLRYCPEVREVVRIRGQAVGDMSLVRRAAVAMPSRTEQRAM